MKFYKLLALLSVGVAGAFPTACTDKYEDMENHMPSWLNSNIYDYLSGRGDCTYYTVSYTHLTLPTILRV
mgnify:CR=1 FL=1